MPSSTTARPPRPLDVGDVVVGPNDLLGEWTAAQITDLDPAAKKVGVLELDWSGPEPDSVEALRDAEPLRLTHHAWTGRLSHCSRGWVLPRSYRVIGNLPLRHRHQSDCYAAQWHLGDQLFRQRTWDRGFLDWSDPAALELTARDLHESLAAGSRRAEIRILKTTGITSLDAARLVHIYPNLTSVTLAGDLGRLTNGGSLNRLSVLRKVFIRDLFGMTSADCLLPQDLPALEFLAVHSVPRDYAVTTRKRWRPEIPHGTAVDITRPRGPEWVHDNVNNPLRDWDGREHISTARYSKSCAQFRQTRRALLTLLGQQEVPTMLASLHQLGSDFAAAFNRLEGRAPFIETEEREELYGALAAVLDEAARTTGRSLSAEGAALFAGVDEARQW